MLQNGVERERGLNRTTVGLKLKEKIFVEIRYKLFESNHGGIETIATQFKIIP